MKFLISLRIRGRAHDVVDLRNDLVFVSDDINIERVCKDIGWEHLDEDYPTAMWIQSVEGEYEDIFITFGSRPYYTSTMVYEVRRDWVEEATAVLMELLNNWSEYEDDDGVDPRLTLIEEFLRKQGLIDG